MKWFRENMARSPDFARVAPYFIFVLLTVGLQPNLGEDARFWVYALKTVVGAWMIWEMWRYVPEMRWAVSWEGLAMGVVVFIIWVGLDGLYPRMADPGAGWNPQKQYGADSALAWFYIGVRILGSTFVVSPIEEVLFRSYLYRYFVKLDFQSLPLSHFHLLSFVVTSAIFGLLHPDRWLAGILCGLAYQWLVVYKGRLGDAMTAHAVTNFLLGLWVVWRPAWNFW